MGHDLIEGNYEQLILDMLARIKKLESKEVYTGELSDMSSDLGLIEAGEFRAHADYLEPKEPGDGFSGVRIVGEGIEINGVRYSLVGYNADTATIGLSSETGEMFFCNFSAVINQDGISGTDLLKWMIKQTATNDTYERTGKLGMALLEGGGVIPVWQLSYESPAGSELVTNGGFETGDFTGWTKTTETNGSWVIGSNSGWSGGKGSKMLGGSSEPDDTASTLVLTSDRMGVTGGAGYIISSGMYVDSVPAGAVINVSVKWYDNVSAGSQIGSTELIQNGQTVTEFGVFVYTEATLSAPVGALSAEIIITQTTPAYSFSYGVNYDGFSFTEITVNQKLQLTDDGLRLNGASIFNYQWSWTWNEAITTVPLYLTANTNWLGGQWRNTAANANNGDEYYFYGLLASGTYSIEHMGSTAPFCGKVDIYLNGTLIDSGNDWYAASGSNNIQITKTGITVTEGRQEIKFKVNGKNASSSDYVLIMQQVRIWRTGA